MCAIHLYADHLAHLFRNELAEMNYLNNIEQIVAADRNIWIREQRYFARNSRSRISTVVVRTT